MRKRLQVWLFRLFALLLFISLIITLPLRFFNPPTWSWQIQRHFAPPKYYPQQPKQYWTNLTHISPYMQLAVIASEDQRFPHHFGIDLVSTTQAVEDMLEGERFRGASTLTQQTVKNLYLWSGKSVFRKAVEAWLSLLLELEWPKQRILEMYLNIAEFGPGIYGVEAASRHYFGTKAKYLTISQAARLAAILPNPYRFSPNHLTDYQQQRVLWIEQQMQMLTLRYLDEIR